jgi:hypothetical protein
MESSQIETETLNESSSSTTPTPGPTPAEAQAKLLAIPVTNENVALNVMVSFLNLAQRRGVFSIDESSKIWECIKLFQKGGQ